MATKRIDIEIPKMDYQILSLALYKNGNIVKLEENDEMYFTVKKSPYDETPLIQKSLSSGINYNSTTKKYEIEITSEDTQEFIMGNVEGYYGYDITIYYSGNRPKQQAIGYFKITDKYTLNEVS